MSLSWVLQQRPHGGGSCEGCKGGSIEKLEFGAKNKGWMGPESRRVKICQIMWSVWHRGNVNGMEVTLVSNTVAVRYLEKS